MKQKVFHWISPWIVLQSVKVFSAKAFLWRAINWRLFLFTQVLRKESQQLIRANINIKTGLWRVKSKHKLLKRPQRWNVWMSLVKKLKSFCPCKIKEKIKAQPMQSNISSDTEQRTIPIILSYWIKQLSLVNHTQTYLTQGLSGALWSILLYMS